MIFNNRLFVFFACFPPGLLGKWRRRDDESWNVSLGLLLLFWLAGAGIFASASRTHAQDAPAATLSVSGFAPTGLRISATDSSGLVEFILENRTDQDRLGRVLFFYQDHPGVQYGKDVWVPRRGRVATSMLVGPVPKEGGDRGREIEYLLYDRTDGTNRWVLPKSEEVRRVRTVFYQKREPTTVLFLGEYQGVERMPGDVPVAETEDEECETFAHVFRISQGFSARIQRMFASSLPATVEAYSGIDHFILASSSISRDPTGWRALRQWVRLGGTLWVALDRVDPTDILPLLQDVSHFHVVDRSTLSAFHMHDEQVTPEYAEDRFQRHDKPVGFARVVLPEHEAPLCTVNGWPAAFRRPLGNGQVIFTTLGPRGWYRPRTSQDGPSPMELSPTLPVARNSLRSIGRFVNNELGEKPFHVEAFSDLLNAEVGYSVLHIRTVAGVFFVFLLGEVLLSFAFASVRKPMLKFLASVMLAGAAAGLLALLSESTRLPQPTVASGQIVNAINGREEVAVHGLAAFYHPHAGSVEIGTEQGAILNLDHAGLEGKISRHIHTDLDAVHWENLSWPAGLRLAPFRFALPTPTPIQARAEWTNQGWIGKLKSGPFQNVGDAVVVGPGDRHVSVTMRENGTFTASADQILGVDQFLTAPSLSDRQQRRLDIMRTFARSEEFQRAKRDHFVLAWADPVALPIRYHQGARQTGEALLMIPLSFEKPQPGTRVTIPATAISHARLLEKRLMSVRRTSDLPTSMDLYFQLPLSLLPFEPETARLSAKIHAPRRTVSLAGFDGGKFTVLQKQESPLDPLQITIDNRRLLNVDPSGRIRFQLDVSDFSQSDSGAVHANRNWTIEYLELTVSGTVQ